MGAYPLLFSLPLFLVAMLFVPPPSVDSTFWLSLTASLFLNATAYFLYMSAIRTSPLSLTIPLLAFTPALMIFTGWIILDEMPTSAGILGIVTTLAGGYVLNINPEQWSLLAPIKAVFRERGSRLMFFTATIYSLSAVIDKKAILHSSPEFFVVFFYLVFSPTLILCLAATGNVPFRSYRRHPLAGLGSGLLLFLHGILHVWAISLTTAAYMVSVKRLSVLFSILYGKLLFHEPHIRLRLLGGTIMLVGTALIAFGG